MIQRLTKIFGSRSKALEILYLLEDIKPVVRQGFYEEELPEVKEFCKKNRLAIEFSPYKIILLDKDKKYSNKGLKVGTDDERRGMYFAYISKDPEKAALANLFETKRAHRDLGIILGYPICCIDFFIKHEPKRSKLDNNYTTSTLENSEGNKFPFHTNICQRKMDITLLSHFPCSFNCKRSVDLAKKHLSTIGKYDNKLAGKFVSRLKSKISIGNNYVVFE